jgi:hypothetical protein
VKDDGNLSLTILLTLLNNSVGSLANNVFGNQGRLFPPTSIDHIVNKTIAAIKIATTSDFENESVKRG